MNDFLTCLAVMFFALLFMESIVGVIVTFDLLSNLIWKTHETKSRKINPEFWKIKDEITNLQKNQDRRFIYQLKDVIKEREELLKFVDPYEKEKQEQELAKLKEEYYSLQSNYLTAEHRLSVLNNKLKQIPDKWFNKI